MSRLIADICNRDNVCEMVGNITKGININPHKISVIKVPANMYVPNPCVYDLQLE